jgi:hypothetical protein
MAFGVRTPKPVTLFHDFRCFRQSLPTSATDLSLFQLYSVYPYTVFTRTAKYDVFKALSAQDHIST